MRNGTAGRFGSLTRRPYAAAWPDSTGPRSDRRNLAASRGGATAMGAAE